MLQESAKIWQNLMDEEEKKQRKEKKPKVPLKDTEEQICEAVRNREE